jgi:hypothetical protein
MKFSSPFESGVCYSERHRTNRLSMDGLLRMASSVRSRD